MVKRTASFGFNHGHLFEVPSGYNLGAMSLHPINVIEENALPPFERGFLHVESAGVHYFVVHLDAHSAVNRVREALAIRSRTTAVENRGKCAIILGDFNTLSPQDRLRHDPGFCRTRGVKWLEGTHG